MQPTEKISSQDSYLPGLKSLKDSNKIKQIKIDTNKAHNYYSNYDSSQSFNHNTNSNIINGSQNVSNLSSLNASKYYNKGALPNIKQYGYQQNYEFGQEYMGGDHKQQLKMVLNNPSEVIVDLIGMGLGMEPLVISGMNFNSLKNNAISKTKNDAIDHYIVNQLSRLSNQQKQQSDFEGYLIGRFQRNQQLRNDSSRSGKRYKSPSGNKHQEFRNIRQTLNNSQQQNKNENNEMSVFQNSFNVKDNADIDFQRHKYSLKETTTDEQNTLQGANESEYFFQQYFGINSKVFLQNQLNSINQENTFINTQQDYFTEDFGGAYNGGGGEEADDAEQKQFQMEEIAKMGIRTKQHYEETKKKATIKFPFPKNYSVENPSPIKGPALGSGYIPNSQNLNSIDSHINSLNISNPLTNFKIIPQERPMPPNIQTKESQESISKLTISSISQIPQKLYTGSEKILIQGNEAQDFMNEDPNFISEDAIQEKLQLRQDKQADKIIVKPQRYYKQAKKPIIIQQSSQLILLEDQFISGKNDQNDQSILCFNRANTYLDWMNLINFSNNIIIPNLIPNPSTSVYQAFISTGNNGVMIRAALRNRWWWSLVESSDQLEEVNFVWTQLRKEDFMKNLQPSCSDYITSNHGIKIVDDSSTLTDSSMINDTTIDSDDFSTNFNQNDVKTNRSHQASPMPNQSPIIIKSPQDTFKSNQQQDENRKVMFNPIETVDSQVRKLLNSKDLNNLQEKLKNSKNKMIFTAPVINESFQYEQSFPEIQQTSVFSKTVEPLQFKMHNHLFGHYHISNQKALFLNMKYYYEINKEEVFENLPLTFHVKSLEDPEFQQFIEYHQQINDEGLEIDRLRKQIDNQKSNEPQPYRPKNVWIIKPGENSNRGNGISVAKQIQDIKNLIKSKMIPGKNRTFIIQKYMQRPFLYNKRKFDFRCFILLTMVNGNLQGYWYNEGYIRTSSREFTLNNLENRMIHLTNEAVQQKSQEFSKFQLGNKLTFPEFQKYLDSNYPGKYNLVEHTFPRMKVGGNLKNCKFLKFNFHIKKLARDAIKSVYKKLDPLKRGFSFQLFGLDFMIDENFKTWLIQCNTNPSLTIACPMMARLLPTLAQNVLQLAVDPIFPPPVWPKSQWNMVPEVVYETNKFQLIFDELVDGPILKKLFGNASTQMQLIYEEESEQECGDEDQDIEV